MNKTFDLQWAQSNVYVLNQVYNVLSLRHLGIQS